MKKFRLGLAVLFSLALPFCAMAQISTINAPPQVPDTQSLVSCNEAPEACESIPSLSGFEPQYLPSVYSFLPTELPQNPTGNSTIDGALDSIIVAPPGWQGYGYYCAQHGCSFLVPPLWLDFYWEYGTSWLQWTVDLGNSGLGLVYASDPSLFSTINGIGATQILTTGESIDEMASTFGSTPDQIAYNAIAQLNSDLASEWQSPIPYAPNSLPIPSTGNPTVDLLTGLAGYAYGTFAPVINEAIGFANGQMSYVNGAIGLVNQQIGILNNVIDNVSTPAGSAEGFAGKNPALAAGAGVLQ